MAISSLTRNLLWERSGHRCVLCQKELAKSIHAFSGNRGFGYVCHIISEEQDEPRYEFLKNYDVYDNLILLCSECRNEIDENWERYPATRLKTLRGVHEAEIRTAIADEKRQKQEKEERLRTLQRISSGEQLFDLIKNVMDFEFEPCEVALQEETNIISEFSQEFLYFVKQLHCGGGTGWQELLLTVINSKIAELEKRDFQLFGKQKQVKSEDDTVFEVAYFVVGQI
jgi:hypothetical protein